jgi:hypothetical protein
MGGVPSRLRTDFESGRKYVRIDGDYGRKIFCREER